VAGGLQADKHRYGLAVKLKNKEQINLCLKANGTFVFISPHAEA
jgi:hypothetical protein